LKAIEKITGDILKQMEISIMLKSQGQVVFVYKYFTESFLFQSALLLELNPIKTGLF